MITTSTDDREQIERWLVRVHAPKWQLESCPSVERARAIARDVARTRITDALAGIGHGENAAAIDAAVANFMDGAPLVSVIGEVKHDCRAGRFGAAASEANHATTSTHGGSFAFDTTAELHLPAHKPDPRDPMYSTQTGEEPPDAVASEPKKRGRKPKGAGAVEVANRYVAEHARIADGVLLRRWRGQWHLWSPERGLYVVISDEQIDAELYRRMRLTKRAEVGDVRHALIAVDDVLIDQAELGSFVDGTESPYNPLDLAVCRNGILHLSDCELIPATPRYFTTSALGTAYDAKAPLPSVWLYFLKQLWPNDPESIELLRQWFGYLLTLDTRQQKILLLLGPKRSGKGTIARVLTALLGAASVASPTLASLAMNFGLWPLIGKSAAIIGDARLSGRNDVAAVVERLLSISGEDLQTIDRKHLSPWTGKLSSRFTIISNELPKFTDASDALANRMLVLQLEHSFFGHEDTDLSAKIIAELPGILRWSIEGWRSLRARGSFVQPASSKDLVHELADLASPIAAWVRQCCTTEASDEDSYLCEIAYSDFRHWCEVNGIKAVPTQTVFGRDLKTIANVRRKQCWARKGARIYAGLASA